MASPEGLLIGRDSRKPAWRIGKLIGSGVCGTVHELESIQGRPANGEFAIKLAPLPKTSSTSKRNVSAVERNANLLNYEKLMYMAQLNKLRGTYIPSLPDHRGPPEFGEVEGFRFLVMEKMDAPLWDVIPRLLTEQRRGKTIAFGHVAAALFDCVNTLHQQNFLFVDVKPENFMLSKQGKTLAQKIRMIDFGLVQDMRGVGGHRPDEGTSSLVGTPLYASLNAHGGHTLSRRDDVEAVGYVIAELLLALLAATRGECIDGKSFLPWSKGTSDEHIFEMKRKELTSANSKFFTNMRVGGNEKAERIMREYFANVESIEYQKKPDYDTLKKLLESLEVIVEPAKVAKKGVTKVATASKNATTGANGNTGINGARVTRSGKVGTKRPPSPRTAQEVQSDVDEDAPSKARGTKRPSPRTANRGHFDFDEDAPSKARRIVEIDDEFFDTHEVIEIADDFQSCITEDASMDWEVTVSDENCEPNPTGVRLGVKIVFTAGPQKGESLVLVKGQTDTIVLGSQPTPQGGSTFQILGDREVADSHMKLDLHATKQMQTVQVTDLRSSNGTYLNGNKITRGKERKAFINDTITIGNSTLKIAPLSADMKSTPKKSSHKSAVTTRKEDPATVTMQPEAMIEVEPVIEEPRTRGPGLQIHFIEGPNKGESLLLEKGVADTLVLGSNPSSKTIPVYQLRKDASVDASHVQLSLDVARKLCTVIVKDLKSKSGTYVNSQLIPSGKSRKAFRNDQIKIGDSVMEIKNI